MNGLAYLINWVKHTFPKALLNVSIPINHHDSWVMTISIHGDTINVFWKVDEGFTLDPETGYVSLTSIYTTIMEFFSPPNRGFGPHLLLDMYGCNNDVIASIDSIFTLLNRLPEDISMTKISQPHVFKYHGKVPDDWGITGTVILAESHISIHTFPERNNFVTMDIYSCKDFDVDKTISIIESTLIPTQKESQVIIRGLKFDR